MHKVQLNDRTKAENIAVYYMEDARKLYDLWRETEGEEERVGRIRCGLRGEAVADLGLDALEVPLVSETELKIGAKQDFTLEKSFLTLHNTKGHASGYYVANLLVKIRWAVENGVYLKLGSFEAVGIAKENSYGEGGFEQVTCCGNPVLKYTGSSIVPQVSEFEDDFVREKITMLGYKMLKKFENVEDVNEDIKKQNLTDEEVERLLHDIPGELG